MSHELEILENGKVCHAYTGGKPWHGLGVEVTSDFTPEQMLKAAGLDWTVSTLPAIVTLSDGTEVPSGTSALVRDSDNKILSMISEDWKPCQNLEAFEFFNDFVAAGDMSMETAGSLKGGTMVFALAKVSESFTINGGKDQVDAYLHFTNPHIYGRSIDVRFTPIRVVCANTLALSLNSRSKNKVTVSHRHQFNGDEVKETLGIAKEKLQKYKEMAEYLTTKRYTNESIVDYFTRVFPVTSSDESKQKELSRNARLAMEVLHTQPGAELGEGTWWQGFNAVTYMTDHLLGRSADTRLQSAWYGANKNLKTSALDLALEMAG